MSKFSGWTLQAMKERRAILSKIYKDLHQETLDAEQVEVQAQFKLLRLRNIEGFLSEDMDDLAKEIARLEEAEKHGNA